MLSRTLWRRALTLALIAVVACEVPSRVSLSGNEATRVDVYPKLLTLQQNQAADFTAIGFTSTGDTADVAIAWSATSGSIIDTTTSNGKHRGRYKAGSDTGKVKIVARGQNGGPADTATVTVTLAPVTSILVSPAAASIAVGQTVQLTATPQDIAGNPLSGRVVTWASTNLGVATVNSSGLVTGVAAGAATVTVACEGQSSAVAITVSVVPVASVSVSPPSASVTAGQTVQLSATPKDANGNPLSGRTVTWATSNAAVASVSGNGLVTGGSAGTATITASSEGKNGTATVTVSIIPVASVAVSPASPSIRVSGTVQLTATAKDSAGNVLTGRVVTWASSAPGVASVSGSGLVTGVAAGTATLTATSEGTSGTATVTVTIAPVAAVTVAPASANVGIGGTVQLSATTKDSAGNVLTGRVVTWTSSAPAVATVSASGLVTGVAAGTITITATSEGKSGTAAITVTVPPVAVASVSVSPASASVTAGQTVQLTATPKDANGTALTGRVVTWGSSNTAVATVSGSGLVTSVAAGSATITATSEGQSGTSALTVTPVPVASVSVSPASATLPTGFVVQLTATPKDASGTALTGRVVTWASSNTAVATVSGSGLVTGVAAGAATITATSEGQSGTSAITVIAPPPPGTSCLTQTGSTITVSGAQTSWGNTSMADNTKVDATTALFAGGANTPVRIGGGSGICYAGGVIIGRLSPATTWSAMHDTYAMVVNGASALTIENVRIFDYGDGPTFDDQGDGNWTFRGAYLKYMRDDCVENDFLNSGLIEDSFFDGCYDFLSSRDYAGAQDGSNNVVVVRNSLARLQAMDRAYSGTVPNHNGFWKWSPTIGPKVALYNNVFRADQPSKEGNGAGMYMAPPPGKLADCENNVMVWLGSGSFPETLPTTFNGKPCFRLLTGAEGLQFWNDAAAQWKANHPWTLVDAGAPITSLFSPGIVGSTTLTGTVTLTATAVDDQAVAGVQFQLDGQNIGAEVTGESPLTKFTLSWDSRGLANGSYTLTVRARDTAGKTTTSAGVTVTISN